MSLIDGARVQFDVPVPMRDGVKLAADVYLPEGAGPFPALLCRTPYDKGAGFSQASPSHLVGNIFGPVRHGFAVVIQDTRGRHASEGDFQPFKHEAADGYDTIEWLAAQQWSNGRIGMFGASYVGATQWLAASTSPPHLTAICPNITGSDYFEGWAYRGGAFELGFSLSWTLSALTLRDADSLRRRLGLTDADQEAMIDAVDGLEAGLRALPLTEQPLVDPAVAPYYREWLAHPTDDDYWRRWRIEDRYAEITIPSLNVGGWHDIFLKGTIRNYLGMKAQGGSEEARRGTRLVIGPWHHNAVGSNLIGATDYGVRSSNVVFDLEGLLINWYRHWLVGEDRRVAAEPRVKIFVMGVNRWRDEADWPLERAIRTRFYLHSDGQANSRHGDGRLSTESPGDEQQNVYRYDPMDPVPTQGGPLCCIAPSLAAGQFDHSVKEDRQDVLVYSTPALERDIEVTGPVTVTLWAASSAVDTDFSAMLLDVGPCGCARNLADGIRRARYRESLAEARPLAPGAVEKYEIDLAATSNVFKKGHSIRVEISSSNFPRFDRNLNTGKGFDDAEVRVAMNTVFHDAGRPSHITLDVVPA